MNPLVKKYGESKQWVNYKIIDGVKIPYCGNKKASSIDINTWKTYTEASSVSNNLGIVFPPDQLLLGIDIDKCLDGNNITHEQKEEIAQLIIEADSYSEISVSGKGLHIFLALDKPLNLDIHRKMGLPYELYTSKRFFIYTGNPYKEVKDIRTVSPEEALKLLSIIKYPWKESNKAQSNTNNLLDEELLNKMFSSKKTGSKIKKLYDGDISDYANDDSSADMALCNHLAFWTNKNASKIESIWISSPLGKRKKTQERKDYRDRTIDTAIKNCKEGYEPLSSKIKKVAPELDLLFTSDSKGNKVFIQNTENICRILSYHPMFYERFRYDIFKNIYEFKQFKLNSWRCLEDNDAVETQTKIQILFPCFSKVGKDMVYDAIIKTSKDLQIDSACDFITSLHWDNVNRLDSWLTTVYGTPNDIYHRAVGSNWLKGLIKRIIEPGCKFDYVLVLEGEQGVKKSTSLSTLGGNWHVETTMSTDNKDFFMQFSGKAIIEFSEGETLNRTEVKRMKAIISTQVDKYRPPYERTSRDFPRRCVFAMTTNQTQYLKDETGNRRWLPVKVERSEADVDWLKTNRDQLFAEAYYRVFTLKETIYNFPKEETLAAQDSRRIDDANTDIIVDWYLNEIDDYVRNKGITANQVYKLAVCGGYPSKPLDKHNEMMISDVLKRTLNLEKKRISKDNVRGFFWFSKDTPILFETNLMEKEIENF